MPAFRLLPLAALVALAAPLRAQDTADPEQALVDALAGSNKLTTRGEYKAARAAYAAYFAAKHAADIKSAFGPDFDTLDKFLKDNPDLRDTLFTALTEDDDIPAALRIFRGLHAMGPDKLKTHAGLAVALCVVWDQPRHVYDYGHHQRRVHATLPVDPDTIGWKENYEYLLAHEADLKGVVQKLPWEFLVHMVNNKTPAAERDWAIKGYAKKRAGIGGIYKDIVYDDVMLQTEMARGGGKGKCKLDGHEYTLAAIREHGGVCAQQADFAARVAKSVAVPAEYIRGEGNSGGLHAWVMWVEVKAVTPEKIDFALMSEGRYFGDQYYIGELADPQTGKPMTDRDMERRLTTVGNAPQHARHADLMMRMYPFLKERKMLTPKQRVAFLAKAFDVFPHCEKAWAELAEIARDGKTLEATDAGAYATRAFTSFAAFPDFCWTLFDPLLTSQKEKTYRSNLFEKAVLKYETLGRPDLACECRLKWADYMEDAKEYKKAADGLCQTIAKFPSEGRYVPKVLAKLEAICGQPAYKDGPKRLAKFYLEFLPTVPKTRGNEVTKYAVEVHRQALAFFKANNMTKEAAQVQATLNTLIR